MKIAQKIAISYYRTKLHLLSVISTRKAAASAFSLFCTPLRRSKRKFPDIFSKSEQIQFRLNGYLIHGYRWNPEGNKKILIVHGFESSALNFDRYISAFIQKGYEVLAFDAPAHGRSSGKRTHLPTYLATIRNIYETYGPIDGYLAHSYGCLVLSHFLENIPHDQNIKAVFIAPATETTTSIDLFFRILRLDQSVRKEFDSLIFKLGGYQPAHYSVRRAMKQIKAEILWFHDEDDELTPLKDALMVKQDQHPNITFNVTKGLGHRRIYRDSTVVKAVTAFL